MIETKSTTKVPNNETIITHGGDDDEPAKGNKQFQSIDSHVEELKRYDPPTEQRQSKAMNMDDARRSNGSVQ